MARDEIEEKTLVDISRAQRRACVMRPANVEPAVWALASERERQFIVRHERMHEIYAAIWLNGSK